MGSQTATEEMAAIRGYEIESILRCLLFVSRYCGEPKFDRFMPIESAHADLRFAAHYALILAQK